jgi:hypothetical protein
MSLEFLLVQKAKSKGGDKYVCIADQSFSIYVPQTMSRDGDQPSPKLRFSTSSKKSASNLEFILVQKAKSKGGDKYACVTDPSFSIYFPQTISRTDDEASARLYVDITIVSLVVKTPVTSQIDEDDSA